MAQETVSRAGWVSRRALGRVGGALASLLGVAAAAACGPAPQDGTAPPKPVSGPKELSLANWATSAGNAAAEETRKAFGEQFGGVTFEEQVTPWAEYINKQIVLMASGSAPDVVTSENEQFPAFAKGTLFKPLGPFFNKDKSLAAKDFFPQLNAGYTYQGEQYCLPSDLAPIPAVYANKRLFDASGLPIPSEAASNAATWDSVVDLARKLTTPDGSQYGLHIEYFETVPYSGGAYYVDDRTAPTKGALDDPRWARAVDLWVDWTTKQRIMPTAADRERLGNANGWALFAQNKVAMFVSGPWHIRNFLQEDPQLPWDMFWVPRLAAGGPRKFRTGGSGHGMTQNARNPDLAWEWLKFNSGKPGYEIGQRHVPPEVVRLRAHIPSNDLEVARLKKLGLANIDIMVKGAPDVLWWPFHAEWPRINGQVLGPVRSRLLRGEEAAAPALKALNEQLTRELQAR